MIWRLPTLCLSFNLLLCVCWHRLPSFRHALSCMLFKARAAAAVGGQLAARAVFDELGLAKEWNATTAIAKDNNIEENNQIRKVIFKFQ